MAENDKTQFFHSQIYKEEHGIRQFCREKQGVGRIVLTPGAQYMSKNKWEFLQLEPRTSFQQNKSRFSTLKITETLNPASGTNQNNVEVGIENVESITQFLWRSNGPNLK